ncbi:ribosome recycling factor [Catalinimonas niigatensis]|uniref:ribosome recycling factor n=1 Tax=Catalinimonas niigatensis TaxID=1397264 RepID=UPI0026660135|nr:ribosome recycling factor [Catalinimonas niigatensis]WPP52534.1 ribosome recycling factor [Catalinimonas niigatensis]
MTEEIQMYLDETDDNMKKAVSHVAGEFKKIRAGKAQPNMLDGLLVDYYGNSTPINQVSSITTPDARTVLIKPWEKKMVNEIERAIINSDLGLNPQNDGEVIRLNIPPLTEERRKNLVKQAKNEAETGKISVRNIRKDANESIKKLLKESTSEDDVKEGEDKVQELTNSYIAKIDSLFEEKEKEIMTI